MSVWKDLHCIYAYVKVTLRHLSLYVRRFLLYLFRLWKYTVYYYIWFLSVYVYMLRSPHWLNKRIHITYPSMGHVQLHIWLNFHVTYFMIIVIFFSLLVREFWLGFRYIWLSKTLFISSPYMLTRPFLEEFLQLN